MKVPDGFVHQDLGSCTVLACSDGADELVELLRVPPWEDTDRFAGCHWLEGRGHNPVVALADGRSVVLRTYRHGGMLQGLTRDLFVGLLPRPFRELAVSAEARRRGVTTPPVLAAAVYPVMGPVYRGVIAVQEIPEARDGQSVLVQAAELGPRQRRQLFRSLLPAAGRAIAKAHEAGLVHTDLNVKNLVVAADTLIVSVIDLDRCRLEPGTLNDAQRRAQLRRLRRSLDKVTRAKVLPPLTEAELVLFLKAYGDCTGRSLRGLHDMMDGWC